MNPKNFNPLLNAYDRDILMGTQQDPILQEDPNASVGLYPSQVDFYGKPIASSNKLEEMKNALQQYQALSKPSDSPGIMDQAPVVAVKDEIIQPPSEMPNQPIVAPVIDAMQREETNNPRDIDFSYEQLQKVLQNRDAAGLQNVLLRAGMMANQGIARMGGADVKPDEGALQALSKQGNVGLENFTTKMRAYGEIEEQDPASDISKFTRERAKEVMKKINPNFDINQFDNMSAAQLKKLGFNIQSIAQQRQPEVRFERVQDEEGNVRLKAFDKVTGQEVRDLGVAGFANQFRTDPNTGELISLSPSNVGIGPRQVSGQKQIKSEEVLKEVGEVKPRTAFQINKLLNPKTKVLVDNAKKEFTKETEEARRVVAGLDGTGEMLKLAESNPSAKPIAAAAITRLFEKGVLTDKDVVRYVERQGIFNSVEDYMTRVSSGTFNKAQERQLLQALEQYKKQQMEQINNIASQKAENVSGYIDPSLNVKSNELKDMIYTEPKNQGTEKVLVVSPDGERGWIPKKQLEAAKKQGYTEVK
jgi:hypothetical protein